MPDWLKSTVQSERAGGLNPARPSGGLNFTARLVPVGVLRDLANDALSEVSAAMGLTGLESLDEFIAANHRNYAAYQTRLRGIPGIQLITYDKSQRRNYQYVIAEVGETKTGISRDDLVRVLHAENILARRYFYPGCHQMEPYRSYFPHAGLLLPETERLTQRVMSLPTGTAVGPEEIDTVCAIVRLAIANGAELSRRLSTMQERTSA